MPVPQRHHSASQMHCQPASLRGSTAELAHCGRLLAQLLQTASYGPPASTTAPSEAQPGLAPARSPSFQTGRSRLASLQPSPHDSPGVWHLASGIFAVCPHLTVSALASLRALILPDPPCRSEHPISSRLARPLWFSLHLHPFPRPAPVWLGPRSLFQCTRYYPLALLQRHSTHVRRRDHPQRSQCSEPQRRDPRPEIEHDLVCEGN